MDSVGTRLKKARKDAGYSRAEAAIETGMQIGDIARMECEEICPTITQVKRLAKLYNVPLKWLCMIGEKDE